MDIFMLVMTIVLSLLLIVMNIYLLAYYSHPEDKGHCSAYTCMVVIVLGMTLSWAQVLMLPLDVSNSRGFGGGIRMDIFWIVIYIATAVFLLIIIPTLSNLYEADPDWTCWEKIKYTFCYLIVTVFIIIIALVVSYAFLSTAEIPIKTVNCSILNIQPSNSTTLLITGCIKSDGTLNIDVSFLIYSIGFMSFISWFLFVVFGGIGLPALPLDYIYDFCTRPIKINPKDLTKMKENLINRAQHVKELGLKCKNFEENEDVLTKGFWNKSKRNYNSLMRQFRAEVAVLDKEYQIIAIQSDMNNSWACQYWLGLILGIFCLIISLAWFIHILLYFVIIPGGEPIYPFLNNLLTALVENNVAFLATAFFALFCMYLLWATIKGNIKFGLRVLLCWAVHPMKKNETYMNSFLFNISLILLSSVSVTQFCAAAFRDYATMTDIDLIFTTQIKYLKFFVYFYKYNIFPYALFGISILSTIYLLCRPSDINSLNKVYNNRKEEELKLKGNSDSALSNK